MSKINSNRTIVALATYPATCAIHIIRLSGNNAYEIINKISKEKITHQGYCIQHTKLIWQKQIIDDVIIVKFIKPHSFTGEDLIEINCHGGLYIAKKIINILINCGATMAERGEFTMKAYLAGKLNLSQAESINNLVYSKNDQTLKIANYGLDNHELSYLDEVAKSLFKIIGQLEVNIDYPEYDDVPQMKNNQIVKELNNIINTTTKIINNSKSLHQIIHGINIGIIGQPNSGKSSLFNELCKEEKAIVSNIAGTTRDYHEASIEINGLTINIIDTAGIRDVTKNTIEKIGIKKTMEIINKCDLILYVIDGSKKENEYDKKFIDQYLQNKKYLVVVNKNDLNQNSTINGINISCKKHQINNLIKKLSEVMKNNLHNIQENILYSNTSINWMEGINELLKDAIKLINQKGTIDLIMQDVHLAYKKILVLTGKEKDYDFINELFKNFCVGK